MRILNLTVFVLLVRSCKTFSGGLTPMIFQCQDWDIEYPEENNVTNSCRMNVNDQDANEFLFYLRKSEYTTRLFKFNLNFNVETFQTKCVIEPREWIWTFPGDQGATHFLKWPKEYRVWSLGLLDSHSFGPMNISINLSGDCPVIIGQNATTQRIGLALLEMANKAVSEPGANVEYGYGYVCYHQRIYIDDPSMYSLCLHIVCPFEAIGYRCCRTVYEYQRNLSRVICEGDTIHYDDAWWIVPFIVGILMFAYVPFLLVKPFQHVSTNSGHDTLDMLDDIIDDKEMWLITNPLSFFGIIRSHFVTFGKTFPRFASIVLRVLVIFCSLFVLIIQNLVHYYFDYDYTVNLVKSGVPLAFRSMVVGYRHSKGNFMPRLGGPFVALAIYIVTTLILVCLPRDLENFINKGIPNNAQISASPLTIDIKTRGLLGSVHDIERQSGFNKVYSLMKAHIYMLINPSFWVLAIQMQIRRFWGLLNIITPNKNIKSLLVLLLVIPYAAIFCIIELMLCVTYCGFPIFLFFQVTVCAYCNGIKKVFGKHGPIGKTLQYILTVLVVGILVFNIYILTVVFVDSFHFITRVLMFTFTGLIAYPGTTYGYFVFTITVIMYMTEAIQQIRSGYSNLFKYVHKCSVKIHNKKCFPHICLVLKKKGFVLLSRDLFIFVVSRHKPIRVEIYFSFLKLSFITFLMYLAIHTIVKLQGLWNINPLTQVVTALFICLIPKLWRNLMTRDDYHFEIRETLIVDKLVKDYCRQKLYTKESNINGDIHSDDEDETKGLLGHSDGRGYSSIKFDENDEEMRSDLLLDMANDL